MTENELRKLLRQSVDRAGSQAAWAEANNVSCPYVCDVLKGRRGPGEAILIALGMEKIVSYRRVTKP